jgi:hypothetical protein
MSKIKGGHMTDITIPQVAGAILDGVQRRITPLTHAELIAVNKECARMRQKPVQRRMTHKRAELDKYKAIPTKGVRRALWGLYGLVLVIGAWVGR